MAVRPYDDHIFMPAGDTTYAFVPSAANRRIEITYILVDGSANITFDVGAVDFALVTANAVVRSFIFGEDKQSPDRIRGPLGATVNVTGSVNTLQYTVGFQEVVG